MNALEYEKTGKKIVKIDNTRENNVFENLTVYNAEHSDIPELVFSEDLDGDNRADVIEWMFP